MTWIEQPAGVYVDMTVVVHALPAVAVEKDGVTYEVQELRIGYRFDAIVGKWKHSGTEAFGYRRQVRQGPRISTPLPTGHRDMVLKYQPDWVPDPSKPPEVDVVEAQLYSEKVPTVIPAATIEAIRRVRATQNMGDQSAQQ